MKKYSLIAIVLLSGCAGSLGCSMFGGEPKIDEGIVIAPVFKVRSSTALAALELAEVKRGDRLDILEQAEVKTPTRTEEWYKVRTKGNDSVVGWVESRIVINKEVADKVNQLYEGAKALPSQGAGRLKVQTRLRLGPDGDVVTYLNKRTLVEIVGKARTTYKPEKQDDSEPDDSPDEPETKTVLWYQVRLPDSEVLRAGWVGAQQVQLDVPDEIIHLEGEGRRFTGWVVYDQVKDKNGTVRSNYIGLMKSLTSQGPFDFTRLWILVYDSNSGRYWSPYIKDGLRGVLPVTLDAPPGRKGFTIHELDENQKPVPIQFEVRREGGRMVVNRLSPVIQVKPPPKKAARG